MTRRALALFLLVGLAACRGEQSTLTDPQSPGAPSFVISDGTKSGGNPDFFFRPPMVADPSGDADYTPGGFNQFLSPTVTVCQLDAATDSQTDPGTCVTGTEVAIEPVVLDLANEQYQVDWNVPRSATVNYYRIFVYLGPAGTSLLLGSADVKTANGSNTPNFVVRKDGTTLPIKFRIESSCTATVCQGFVDLEEGGTVLFKDIGGVVFPEGNEGGPIHVTIEECGDLPVDIPLFGSCLRIETDLESPLTPLPAIVFVCDAEPPAEGLSEAQHDLVTLHRKDGSVIQALPHAEHACPEPPPVITSVKGLIRALVHREWKSARGQLFGLLAPKPLYARRLDVGPGGSTFEFSDFQFALPAYMEIVAATDNQSGVPGQPLPTNPTVVVKDLNHAFVAGATVHFEVLTPDGSVNPVTAVSNASGEASVQWTLGAIAGANTLKASGRGIAASNANGPRPERLDPFIPLSLSEPFDDEEDGPAETLATGELTFSATGLAAGFDFQSPGYVYLTNVKNDAHITWYGNARNSGIGPLAGTQLGTVDVPADWYLPAFAPTGWSTGSAAFGAGTACSGLAALVQTAWSLNTNILVRKQFATASTGTVTITVHADNDLQIWLDGDNITKLAAATINGHVELGGAGDDDDWFVHGFCADAGPPVVTIAVGAGVHTLALRGDDYGSQSHLDARVVFNVNVPD